MRSFTFIILALLAISLQAKAQIKFPVEFRVEKQSMSTPMSDVEDILFVRSYFARPVNIKFDGTHLNMVYDNGEIFAKKTVSTVKHDTEYEDNVLSIETYTCTDNANPEDLILFVVDYSVGYFQVILTTKNSKGESVGYTSFRQYVNLGDLALSK